MHKVILVTSAAPGEGKTTVLCNVAGALADTGRNVLVIDAALRQPRAASIFGIDRTVGLTSVLADDARLERVVVRWKGVLDIVPSGTIRPNPGELLVRQNGGITN